MDKIGSSISETKDFLTGGGEMERLIRSFNWSNTCLGPVDQWSQSLKTAVNIVLQSPVPLVMLWGPDGIMIYNEPYSKFAGARHPFLLGSKVVEGWPEVADFNRNVMDKGLKGESLSYKDQQLTLHRNNKPEEVWMDLSYSPVMDENGNPAGVLAVVIETTQRVLAERKQKHAEEALSYQSHLTKTITNNATVALFLMDAKGCTTYMNPAAEKITGYRFQELEGKVLHDMIHRIHKDGTPFPMEECRIGQTVFSLGELKNHEDIFNRKDGSLFPVFCSATAIYEKGELKGIILEAQDITERKTYEDAILESEQRFRFIADTSPTMIWMVDSEGKLTYYNKTLRDFTGYSDEDVLLKSWEPVVHPDDLPWLSEKFSACVQRQEPFEAEIRIRRHDGNYFYIFSVGVPRYTGEGEFIGFVGSGFNIHDRKQAEENLKLKNEQLIKTNNDLDNFIYTASHDLRAPVSNLEGLFNTLLNEIELNDDLVFLKGLIDESFERFKNTIQDLTEITKVQKGQYEETETIPFVEIIEDVKTVIKDQIKKNGAEIFTDFGVAELKFSRKNLRSILYNFISNAIKYSSPERKPVIHLSTRKQDNFILLSISDNGLGLSPANQRKIFQMFKRFHDHVEGTGIGLYIVKRIIDNAGGKIEVESEVGKGTTFNIFFPRF